MQQLLVLNKTKSCPTIPWNKLKTYEFNALKEAKDRDVTKLKNSIVNDGFRFPMFIWADHKFVIDGAGRDKALLELEAEGYQIEDVPVVEIEAENKREAKMLALQASSRYGDITEQSYNDFTLDMELTEPDFGKFDLGLDFSMPEVEQGEIVEDEAPEVQEEAITKPGDVWILGEHRAMCGDSTVITDVDKLMGGEKADMVFTDPPYQIETKGGCKGSIGIGLKKQDADIEFISDFNPSEFLQVLPVVFTKNKINSYIFCNKQLLPNYLNWANECNYSFNVLIWKKPNSIPIGDSHRPDIEYLLLFRRSATWNNGLKGVNYSRCLEFGRERGLHPTMKPVELIANEILISSNKDNIVMDFFGGSGSTLIAAEQTGRKCYTMELDPRYVSVIVERWQNLTGKEAVLESNGKSYNELKSASA